MLAPDDEDHPAAKRTWSDLMENRRVLITSNYVVVETFALLQPRRGLKAARAFSEDILPVVRIEWITDDVHNAATATVFKEGRRDLSLVDATSFETMRRLRIRDAFAFDPDFRRHGFRIVP